MSVCHMGKSGLVIRQVHAQCSVITKEGKQGFSKTGPHIFSVYGVILYKCCL